MVDFADQSYLENMDQADGVFNKEDFRHPAMEELTRNAKDVVSQIMDKYNSGDADVRSAVSNFEMQKYGNFFANNPAGKELLKNSLSADKLSKDSAWELFYQAHQKYIGQSLTSEDTELPDDQRALLEARYGFDMGGSKLFDFESLMAKGKIAPKGAR